MHSELYGKFRGPLFILLASLCWSTTGTSQALAPEGATPYVLSAIRLWFGFFFLFCFCALTGRLPEVKGLPGKAALLSAMGILLFQLCFFASVARTGVAVGTVAMCGLSPITAGFFAFVLLRERPSNRWYATTVLAVIGIALLSLTGEITADPLGLALALLATCGYAFYVVFAKKLTGADPAVVIMALFAIGAACVTPVFFLFPTEWMLTPRGLAVSLNLGLVATALGYTCYLTGLRTTPVATAATLNLSESIAASCWSVLLLGERLQPPQLFGMALIFLSTTALTLRPR
jgi:DME family drug/metabolite transporter